LAGRSGRRAGPAFPERGNAATSFSVAGDERRGGEKTTLGVDCTSWGERGEKIAEFLTKRTAVAVAGQVGVRSYEKGGETHAVLTLRVQELTFMGGGAGGEGGGDRPARGASRGGSRPAPAQEGRSTRGGPPAPSNEDPFPDDDIPF